MSLLRYLFGPRNSLVLVYDHLNDDEANEMEVQLDEIKQFYSFVPLSKIAQDLRRHRAIGQAAVVFLNARKSFFIRAVPRLREREIPFTLFLRPDCIGLNRLPQWEEARAFQTHYPEPLKQFSLTDFAQTAWEDPSRAESILEGFRKTVGPYPLNQLDPTQYFATWGQILQIPPAERDFGIHLAARPRHLPALDEALTFLRKQTATPIQLAYCSGKLAEGEGSMLRERGVEGVLTTRTGFVVRETDPFELPQFSLERAKDETDENLQEKAGQDAKL